MKLVSHFFVLCIALLMPFSAFADIGSNPGLDFYSRIDESGDKVAQKLTRTRLSEKGTYGNLGCGASWMVGVPIDQGMLDELRVGTLSRLGQLASQKKVSMSTDNLSQLSQCLVEKYNDLESGARKDQDTLETVGNIGLYMDGDTANSDYDILTDISRINTIIFSEKYEYKWVTNQSARATAALLAGNPIAPLFLGVGVSVPTVPGAPTAPLNPPSSTSTGSQSGSGSVASGSVLPWAGVCIARPSGSPVAGTADIFGEWVLDDIGGVVSGDTTWGNGFAYSPIGTDILGRWSDTAGNSANPLATGADFHNTLPCDEFFCVTLDMIGGNRDVLGGSNRISIESLLDKHIKMMEPISYSDLSAQKMTNNSYQLPWLNVKIADKIAGLRTYVTTEPQITKTLKSEDTKSSKDAIFDAAFRCAMNESWLPGDLTLANGLIGAGFNGLKNTNQVEQKTLPLGPKEMDSLAGCYQIRMQQWKKTITKSLSTDFNEIQAFTTAMMQIIDQILTTDLKLDKLPTK
jgi:hypothetical protein